MDIHELAKKIAPLIAVEMLTIPVVWGDVTRVKKSEKSYLNNATLNTSSGEIIIEDHVFFGHGVSLITGTHDFNKKGLERINSYPKEGRDIIIRTGVWIASNVTVIGPCEIGENSVVGAGSLVLGDIPADCVYAGSPAKFIKKIE